MTNDGDIAGGSAGLGDGDFADEGVGMGDFGGGYGGWLNGSRGR